MVNMFTGFITWLNSLQSGLAQVLAVIIAIMALVFSGALVVKAFQAAHKKSWSDLAIYVILIVIVCILAAMFVANAFNTLATNIGGANLLTS